MQSHLPVSVPVFALGWKFCFLFLGCSCGTPNVALQNHLEQREVDVNEPLGQIAATCSGQQRLTGRRHRQAVRGRRQAVRGRRQAGKGRRQAGKGRRQAVKGTRQYTKQVAFFTRPAVVQQRTIHKIDGSIRRRAVSRQTAHPVEMTMLCFERHMAH